VSLEHILASFKLLRRWSLLCQVVKMTAEAPYGFRGASGVGLEAGD